MTWPTATPDALTVADAAALYAGIGFRVTPVHGIRTINGRTQCTCGATGAHDQAGKHPVGAGWQRAATANPDAVRQMFEGHSGNVGLVLGTDLLAIDVDGAEGRASVEGLALPETLRFRSGRVDGGEHLVYALPKWIDRARLTARRGVLPGVDLRYGDGSQIVAPPSMHRSGNVYSVVCWREPAVLPQALFELLARPARVDVPSLDAKRAAKAVDRAVAYVASMPVSVSGSGGHDAAFAVANKLVNGFSLEPGMAFDVMARHFNPKCQPPWSERELEHKIASAVESGRASVVEHRPRVEPAVVAAEPAPAPAYAGWGLTVKRGRFEKTFANVVRIVRNATKCRFDAFRLAYEVDGKPLSGSTIGRVRETIMDREFHIDVSHESVERAILLVAEENTHHSLADWLGGLSWDGVPRLDRIASDVLRLQCASQLQVAMLRRWCIGAVARAMKPGTQVDHILVLQGAQGLRKSTFFQTLAGFDWYSDSRLDLRNKDSVLQLYSAWIYAIEEVDELTLTRSSASEMKAFLTQRQDAIRAPYERAVSTRSRHTVFAGTTNKQRLLDDDTGARRWWVIPVTQCIDTALLSEWREQLWAEAAHVYGAGEKWWLDEGEQAEQSEVVKGVQVEDPWLHKIAAWMSVRQSATSSEVLEHCLQMVPRDMTRSAEMRVGSCLRLLGYSNPQVSQGGNRVRLWRRM